MRTLGLAFIIVLGAAAACFGVLSLFGVADKIAGPFAGLFLGAITYVHQVLERKDLKATPSTLPKGIVALKGFFLPWPVMIVYGTLILLATLLFTASLAGIVAGSAEVKNEFLMRIVGGLLLPAMILGAYFIGRWVGTRIDDHGFIVILIMALASRVLFNAVDWIWLPATEWEVFYHEPKSLRSMLENLGISFAIIGAVGALGVWRGHKARLSQYLRYLLSRLPYETRLTIVGIAYEEADKLTGGALRGARHVELS